MRTDCVVFVPVSRSALTNRTERLHGGNHLGADTLSAMKIEIRHARPSDYGRIYPLVNEWWGGREMTQHLAGVFFVHFEGSSFIAETSDCTLAGFLCGFLSQTDPAEAYVHMSGVAPELRRQGVGGRLYEAFFETAREHGRSLVHLVTAPFNSGSIAFHEALGFELERILDDYAGPGENRLLFVKHLS